jgi:hypothetical protein
VVLSSVYELERVAIRKEGMELSQLIHVHCKGTQEAMELSRNFYPLLPASEDTEED